MKYLLGFVAIARDDLHFLKHSTFIGLNVPTFVKKALDNCVPIFLYILFDKCLHVSQRTLYFIQFEFFLTINILAHVFALKYLL